MGPSDMNGGCGYLCYFQIFPMSSYVVSEYHFWGIWQVEQQAISLHVGSFWRFQVVGIRFRVISSAKSDAEDVERARDWAHHRSAAWSGGDIQMCFQVKVQKLKDTASVYFIFIQPPAWDIHHPLIQSTWNPTCHHGQLGCPWLVAGCKCGCWDGQRFPEPNPGSPGTSQAVLRGFSVVFTR